MTSTSPTRPTLILTTCDNPVALNLVLEAISLQTQAPFEVLIADCGSDEQTTDVIEQWTLRLGCRVERFWESSERFQKAKVLNRVVRAAQGDYLIFIEGDCLPHRRFVSDHVQHAETGVFVQGRRAGIKGRYVRRVSPKNFNPLRLFLSRQLYGVRRGLRRPWPAVRRAAESRLKSCNFAVWREDFFRVNGYDENFVGWGHEDAELAVRLNNAGLSCKTVTGQAIVYHLDHARVRRYRTSVNERILEQAKAEKRTRCERGLSENLPSAA